MNSTSAETLAKHFKSKHEFYSNNSQKNVLSHAMTKAVSFAQSKLKILKAVYSKSMSPTSQKKLAETITSTAGPTEVEVEVYQILEG